MRKYGVLTDLLVLIFMVFTAHQGVADQWVSVLTPMDLEDLIRSKNGPISAKLRGCVFKDGQKIELIIFKGTKKQFYIQLEGTSQPDWQKFIGQEVITQIKIQESLDQQRFIGSAPANTLIKVSSNTCSPRGDFLKILGGA